MQGKLEQTEKNQSLKDDSLQQSEVQRRDILKYEIKIKKIIKKLEKLELERD